MTDQSLPYQSPGEALNERCDDCTGGPDEGRGHTLRGDCMGAACKVCGDPKYLHSPGEHGIAVRGNDPYQTTDDNALEG